MNADGLLIRELLFDTDTDAQRTAISEAAEQFMRGEGAEHAGVLEVSERFDQRLGAGEFEFLNHDEFGTLTGDRAHFLTGLHADPTINGDGSNFTEQMHRVAESGVVGVARQIRTTEDGFAAEWVRVRLSIIRGGKIQRTEIFSEEQLDEALARFDELTADPTDG